MQSIPIKNVGSSRLVDAFQRTYYYLRLSITDQCNFRCNYCLPNGYQPETNKPGFLTLSEITRVAQTFANMGTRKIRLTGGEPTLRKDFLAITENIAQIEGINQVALTTNGYRMLKDVDVWKRAGITSINVSVDSLDPKMFHQITGINKFDDVIRGIERAFEVGYEKIKVNSVLMKNLNDIEFNQFLDWVKYRPIQMRFIELMQTGEMDHFFHRYHLSGQILADKLIAQGWKQQQKTLTDGPAKVFNHPNYKGEIGLIMPYEKNFCASCNRLRVSSKGKLHLCLFGEEGIELRDLLQSDEHQTLLQARIFAALQGKREHHYLHQGDSGIRNHLASIGG
ncbi:GTP 3',8-cyclase MoaA [Rodentibacter pneumotropicus]|uniref:GTP 3',8-cyclase MoaA n=1 Tax=Rodentibacter pneumotropicus TaxID=758 RepID=UPI00037FDE80|nr:GTP 3',8-cyclase MoaA [Rodentibacter pneumotropicus]NBH74753.1 GTP 3',8-cyclase MoaA [Rodentibacter pneumotropicus]OOF62841.1 cyclic pyranopterin phosphate synthase [Rodentibacter pneumotropicus]THA02630.1 GTP 3',8-cyclase MoaA [Rodentibacter pneumotropicus]THA04616.1 GTP 3',8-cyclase MoaA [Rodentibacter pneumotropicus]THA12463.1 GTP 3',8-cyclase MoaA [Rodentibacter pneumotropicus]